MTGFFEIRQSHITRFPSYFENMVIICVYSSNPQREKCQKLVWIILIHYITCTSKINIGLTIYIVHHVLLFWLEGLTKHFYWTIQFHWYGPNPEIRYQTIFLDCVQFKVSVAKLNKESSNQMCHLQETNLPQCRDANTSRKWTIRWSHYVAKLTPTQQNMKDYTSEPHTSCIPHSITQGNLGD